MMFVSATLLLDLDLLAEAHTVNGSEEYDGVYALQLHLHDGDGLKETTVLFTDQTARDATFAALGARLTERARPRAWRDDEDDA